MILIDKHVDGVLEITPWAGCLKLGLVNPGLMRNLSSDTKAKKQIRFNSFVYNLIIERSKKNRENYWRKCF